MRYVGQPISFVGSVILKQNGKGDVYLFLKFSVMLRYVKCY
jgi:hypothetical protein